MLRACAQAFSAFSRTTSRKKMGTGALLGLLLLLLAHSAAAQQRQPQVAIIGGGLGGTAAAYWLRKLRDNDVNITM